MSGFLDSGFCRICAAILSFVFVVCADMIAVPAASKQLNIALARSQKGDTLVLENGRYRGGIRIPAGVSLVARETGKAHISGTGKENVVILSNGNTISGLKVTGGRIGVYSEGMDNSVLSCLISNNKQSGILAVAHFVRIEDNLIFRNSGSGILMWDVETSGEILNNTIVYNENHGISLGGACKVGLTNNIIAYNGKFAVKISDKTQIFQEFNVFLSYIQVNMTLPEDNYSFDPEFKSPELNDFRLKETSRCYNNGRNGEDIGSRIYTAL
ncbi:MAG: right-handed parallel beta-helix repeat-containing protein [Chitinispirillales bacterium]|nr:right-handed parallel beta-helix repeat-containing protein [Chitinispirillales bacterium]